MNKPIFYKLRQRAADTVIFILLIGLIGCNAQTFDVVGPGNLEPDTGSALITASIPPFARGLIQRVRVKVSAADAGRIQTVERDMNFPIPGGNLATGQVADIPTGKRRFTVSVFDTDGVLRFRGGADSIITVGETELVQVNVGRIGGQIAFRTVIDFTTVDTTKIDSVTLAALPLTSILDVLEIVSQASHNKQALLPLLSVGLGGQFSVSATGVLSRQIQVNQIPIGQRRFVAHLRDLSSGGNLAFADTIIAQIDTLNVTQATFQLRRVESQAGLLEVFNKTTLPRDSTVVVVTPVF
ncbi:MAG: hypothetical protein HN521_06130 [Candidatus Latescibacteria bacterium]|jgi:hypothetical protein|nr:hypothetical protein [Candidatus Latescibacterota bacterium]